MPTPMTSENRPQAAVFFTERLTGSMAAIRDGSAQQLPTGPLKDLTIDAFGELLRVNADDAAPLYDVEVNDLVVRVALGTRTPQGGLHGHIVGGTVAIPAIHPAPLPVRGGSVDLLARMPTGQGRMRYRFEFGSPDGRQSWYVLHGAKRLATHRSLAPRKIWRETTTLYSGIYQMPAEQLVLFGTLVLHPRDFIQQLRSLKADRASDPDDDAAAVARFLGTFAATATRVYLTRALGRAT